jgi:hypothetical protein
MYADLKTTVSVATDALRRALADYGYHQQGALVAEASRHVLGVELESFSFVWVEKAAPWCVRVTTLSAEDLTRGAMQNAAALREFARCTATNTWPGPGGDQSDGELLTLNPFAAKRIDERLEELKQTTPYAYAAE